MALVNSMERAIHEGTAGEVTYRGQELVREEYKQGWLVVGGNFNSMAIIYLR